MRFVVPLLLMVGVALPSASHAKTAKPRPAKVARAAQPATHGSGFVGAAWAVPASTSMMAVAMTGVAAMSGGRDQDARDATGVPQRGPRTFATAPTVSPD